MDDKLNTKLQIAQIVAQTVVIVLNSVLLFLMGKYTGADPNLPSFGFSGNGTNS